MAKKRCSQCDTVKDHTEFHRNKKKSDGCSAWCRTCMSAYMKARHQANPERNRKASLAYYHATAKTDAVKIRARSRLSYSKHRDTRLVVAAKYRKSPQGKASKAKYHLKRRAQIESVGPLDTIFVAHLFATSTHCVFCKRQLVDVPNHPQEPTLEHLTPLSRQGTNASENLATSCRSCNSRKYTLTAEEFRKRMCATSETETATPG